jgi:hypothetical protein
MALTNKTYQPVQAISVLAGEDLPAFRFVSHLGTLCTADSRALGVTEVNWLKDEHASVVTLGTIAIETTTTIDAGADITSDEAGKAMTAGPLSAINGRALDSCNGSGFIRIKLVP